MAYVGGRTSFVRTSMMKSAECWQRPAFGKFGPWPAYSPLLFVARDPELCRLLVFSFYTPTWALRDVSWLHRLSAGMRLLTLSWYWRARTQRDDILLGSSLCSFISTCFQHFQAPDAATAGHDGSQLRKSDPFRMSNLRDTNYNVEHFVSTQGMCAVQGQTCRVQKVAKSSWLCEKSTNTHRRKSAVSEVPMNNGFVW